MNFAALSRPFHFVKSTRRSFRKGNLDKRSMTMKAGSGHPKNSNRARCALLLRGSSLAS